MSRLPTPIVSLWTIRPVGSSFDGRSSETRSPHTRYTLILHQHHIPSRKLYLVPFTDRTSLVQYGQTVPGASFRQSRVDFRSNAWLVLFIYMYSQSVVQYHLRRPIVCINTATIIVQEEDPVQMRVILSKIEIFLWIIDQSLLNTA